METTNQDNNMRIKKAVLDTSLFVNPDVRYRLGENPTIALKSFLEDAMKMKDMEFYMPPSVFDELQNFIEIDKIPSEYLLAIIQKSPKRYELTCPALFLYELIDEIRDRVNKGLRIAEKAVRDTPIYKIDEVIQDLRRKYRDALREGIIDSKEDVDLLLLALELDSYLITADKGLIKWADKLGIKWLFSERFIDLMNLAFLKDKTDFS
ncbi:MAG: RNA ligase partner protein [Thermodesulfovibrionales bacterium]|nr:RNA ligase partner protein [Thermodesulfovibrionales bacterium]